MFTNVHVSSIYNPGENYVKTNAIKNAYIALAVKILFLVLYGYLLQILCKNNLDTVAWIIMFLPFILFAFIILFAMAIGTISAIRG